MSRWEVVIGWVCAAGLALIIAVMLLSCAQSRITGEIVYEGDPDLLVIPWPAPVPPESIRAYKVDGETLVVGPLETEY